MDENVDLFAAFVQGVVGTFQDDEDIEIDYDVDNQLLEIHCENDPVKARSIAWMLPARREIDGQVLTIRVYPFEYPAVFPDD